jgi:hypothetical protein
MPLALGLVSKPLMQRPFVYFQSINRRLAAGGRSACTRQSGISMCAVGHKITDGASNSFSSRIGSSRILIPVAW